MVCYGALVKPAQLGLSDSWTSRSQQTKKAGSLLDAGGSLNVVEPHLGVSAASQAPLRLRVE